MVRISFVVVLITFLSVIKLYGDIKMPALFSDHMVLQQQADVPVWGWATPGEKIELRFGWSKSKLKAKAGDDGKWEVTIKTPVAGGPFDIKIMGKDDAIVISDILIGEVWLCSGQSNMVFRLSHSLGGEQEVKSANYPTIRYMEVERQVSDVPLEDAPGSVWNAITPDNAGAYSAVAMYFAIKLQEELHVPVGIMEAAWGGTAANSWTPTDVLKNDSSLSVTFDRWEDWKRVEKGDSIGYYSQLKAWENGVIANKPEMPTSVFIKQRPHRQPGSLYNGMINPLTNFAIKGVLWYQGETNRTWSNEYAYLFRKMIQSWRVAWHKDLPFYFVQLAPYGGKVEAVSEIMEAQLQVMKTTENTGMVITMDVGNMDNIHPTNKKPVGERLAAWALANTYGFEDLIYSGPLFKEIKQEKDRVRILFDHTGSGLVSQGKLNGFEIIEFNNNGTEKTARPVGVEISGDELVLSTHKLNKPFIIQYAWAEKMVVGNLFNQAGLPASCFRVLVK